MFGNRIRLFKLFSIPIFIDLSWLIIAALLSWTLARMFYEEVPDLLMGPAWGLGVLTALLFFACILLHEMGHAVVAQRLGVRIRGITLFIFGGVAEMEGEPPSAGKEFLVAIGGPVVSVFLAVGFWGLGFLGAYQGWEPGLVMMFAMLAYINTMVLIFNLIPAFPLDGGRVLRSALWAYTGNLRKATRWASWSGQGFAWVLLFWGLYDFVTGNPVAGLWRVLIGLFLNNAARSSYEMVVIKEALSGEKVARFMNPSPIAVSPHLDIPHWIEDHVYRHHHKGYPVVDDAGQLVGLITTRDLAGVPRQEWDHYRVGDVMRNHVEPLIVRPDTDALDALQQMQRTDSTRLLVVDDGRLLGMVCLKDLLRFLDLKLELEGTGEQPPPPPPPRPVPTGRKEEPAIR